jgi:hypothetical protein
MPGNIGKYPGGWIAGKALQEGSPQRFVALISCGIRNENGDYNVVPTDFGIYNPRSWLNDALLQPESRERYRRLLDQGWADAPLARYGASQRPRSCLGHARSVSQKQAAKTGLSLA